MSRKTLLAKNADISTPHGAVMPVVSQLHLDYTNVVVFFHGSRFECIYLMFVVLMSVLFLCCDNHEYIVA